MGTTGCYQAYWGVRAGLLRFAGHKVTRYNCHDGKTLTMHLESPRQQTPAAAAAGSNGMVVPASPPAGSSSGAVHGSSGGRSSDQWLGYAGVVAVAAAEDAIPASAWKEHVRRMVS